jgi:hypothetical protein
VAQDNIDHGLRHRARINRGRLHGFRTNVVGEFVECRFGDERVELTVYPLWDQDFRTGLRELERTGQQERTVPIEALADLIATDLRERHGSWFETRADPLEVGTHRRGLGLLEETATVRGVDVRRDGKCVWFEVEKPPDEPATEPELGETHKPDPTGPVGDGSTDYGVPGQPESS